MIKQVTKFETEDGRVFDTEKEAEKHEFELTFCNLDSEDVWAWFKEDRSKLLNFLNKIS